MYILSSLNLSNYLVERFLFDCWKVIGFALTILYATQFGLKKCLSFIQSEVKLKPIVTHAHIFPALRQLHVLPSSFNWLTVLLCPL